MVEYKSKYVKKACSIYFLEVILKMVKTMTIKTRTKQESITIEDVIQELAYQNNKDIIYKNNKDIRKQILHNYLVNDISNKQPNKYRIEKSIKKLNYEMENASQEFSKLFNVENVR